MNSKARTLVLVLLSIVSGVMIGLFVIPSGGSNSFSGKGSKIDYILSLIDSQYVDKVDMDSLQDEAIRSFLSDLDPHSVYMTAEEIKKENEVLQGNFDGIGIQFRIIEDSIVVVQTINPGPSQRAGIMAGDRITKVDGNQRKGFQVAAWQKRHKGICCRQASRHKQRNQLQSHPCGNSYPQCRLSRHD